MKFCYLWKPDEPFYLGQNATFSSSCGGEHSVRPQCFCPKCGGEMFACYSPSDEPLRVNLKCNPERAIELREKYEEIIPGYHMNKRHWNTLYLDGNLPVSLVKELIEHSYSLVLESLTRKIRLGLGDC